jgi:hypothetical protein
MQVREPLTLQECDDLHTSHPVMTNYDRGMLAINLVDTSGNLVHRHVVRAFDARKREFPRLAYVKDERLLSALRAEQISKGFWRELAHRARNQKEKRDGSGAFTSGGNTVSNNSRAAYAPSPVLVMSVAFMTGASPTIAKSRPPTVKCCR